MWNRRVSKPISLLVLTASCRYVKVLVQSMVSSLKAILSLVPYWRPPFDQIPFANQSWTINRWIRRTQQLGERENEGEVTSIKCIRKWDEDDEDNGDKLLWTAAERSSPLYTVVITIRMII